MPFLYLRDPLFIVCLITYAANRFILEKLWLTGFVHEHFNDLICIPFWVPIMLFFQRCIGLREHDQRPSPSELIIPLLIWSWVFEIILPRMELFSQYCVADYMDIVFYSGGTLVAGLFWRWWYANPPRNLIS